MSLTKKGIDKAWVTMDKLGGPVNRLSNKVGCEAFWPMTLDKESDKAARILRSFCTDGFYGNIKEKEYSLDEGPKGKQRVVQKIPTKVIKQAKGLCIFTTMRSGLWIGGSGGSGVLLGRIPETGEWSPPSGVLLNTTTIGFLAGVDIYDCVIVINNYEALKAFKTFRCTLGGSLGVSAGPVGVGGILDTEVHKRQQPVWTYIKSRGLYAGAEIAGSVIVERVDENERFYYGRYSVDEILGGKVRHPPFEIRTLMETVKAAEGNSDVDLSAIPPEGATPGDMELLPPGSSSSFGIPAADDPDPFGVKALEAEGLFIKEAGTEFKPEKSNDERDDEFYDVKVYDIRNASDAKHDLTAYQITSSTAEKPPEYSTLEPTGLATVAKRAPPPLPPRDPQHPMGSFVSSSYASPPLEAGDANESKLSHEHDPLIDGLTTASLADGMNETDADPRNVAATCGESHVMPVLSSTSSKEEEHVAHEVSAAKEANHDDHDDVARTNNETAVTA